MSKLEVAQAIASSSGNSFEQEICCSDLLAEDLLQHLDLQSFFDLIKRPFPMSATAITETLLAEKFIGVAPKNPAIHGEDERRRIYV